MHVTLVGESSRVLARNTNKGEFIYGSLKTARMIGTSEPRANSRTTLAPGGASEQKE